MEKKVMIYVVLLFSFLLLFCSPSQSAKYIDNLMNATNITIRDLCTFDGNECDGRTAYGTVNCSITVRSPDQLLIINETPMNFEGNGWFNYSFVVNKTGLWDGTKIRCTALSNSIYYNESEDISFYVVSQKTEDYLKSINFSVRNLNDSMFFYVNTTEIIKSIRNMNNTDYAYNFSEIRLILNQNLTYLRSTLQTNFSEVIFREFIINNSMISFKDGTYSRIFDINNTLVGMNLTVLSVNTTVTVTLSDLRIINLSLYSRINSINESMSAWLVLINSTQGNSSGGGTVDLTEVKSILYELNRTSLSINTTLTQFVNFSWYYWNCSSPVAGFNNTVCLVLDNILDQIKLINSTTSFLFSIDAPSTVKRGSNLEVTINARTNKTGSLEAQLRCYLENSEGNIFSEKVWYSKIYDDREPEDNKASLYVPSDFINGEIGTIVCKIRYYEDLNYIYTKKSFYVYEEGYIISILYSTLAAVGIQPTEGCFLCTQAERITWIVIGGAFILLIILLILFLIFRKKRKKRKTQEITYEDF